MKPDRSHNIRDRRIDAAFPKTRAALVVGYQTPMEIAA